MFFNPLAGPSAVKWAAIGLVAVCGFALLFSLGAALTMGASASTVADYQEQEQERAQEAAEIEADLNEFQFAELGSLRDKLDQIHLIVAAQRRQIEELRGECADAPIVWGYPDDGDGG